MLYLHHGDRVLPLWEVPCCNLRYLHAQPLTSILCVNTCDYHINNNLAHSPKYMYCKTSMASTMPDRHKPRSITCDLYPPLAATASFTCSMRFPLSGVEQY